MALIPKKGIRVENELINNALRSILVEREHRFRKITEKGSPSAGMAVHVKPERVFMMDRNMHQKLQVRCRVV
jgi:hypothetical protein